ncbi:hypothetical protein Goarm_001073 [Gossypium armourianum]|uniref:Uncharacterized protein n=1 Tax=Gossypium armourianum TaxID=34283 RepID=A0A7J9KBV5_9ROSI|nr:hypothetical protein [Gossypium armourianum]
MSGFSQSSASSQNSQRTKRKWVPEENVTLVACVVSLYNVETYNADTRFNASYLNELERIIRTLKMDWATVYDLLSGKDNSSFGCDEHRQMIHKEAGQCRHHSFPYYDQLTSIYAKDRATGKYAQTAVDIFEEIDAEDVATANNIKE